MRGAFSMAAPMPPQLHISLRHIWQPRGLLLRDILLRQPECQLAEGKVDQRRELVRPVAAISRPADL